MKIGLRSGLLIGLVLSVAGFWYLYVDDLDRQSQVASPQRTERAELPSPVPSNSTSTPSSLPVAPPGAALCLTFEEFSTIGPFPAQVLQVSRLPNGWADLEWFYAHGFIQEFNVYRKEGSSDWVHIDCIPADPEDEWFSYVDKSVRSEAPYVYAVTAVDIFGNESEYSNLAEIP